MTRIAYLPDRGVIHLSGPDRVAFLQGLTSNDVTAAAPGRCVWSALLTPQGRYRAEFFIFATTDALLLDAPRSAIPDIITTLSRFRLRSKVTLTDRSDDFAVHAIWDGAPAIDPLTDPLIGPDPRLPEAGLRRLAPSSDPDALGPESYLAHRLALGLPDHADLEPETTLLLEAGFDELHGIDWAKGCYMGQELTARTRYRGLVKRRLIPIEADADLPASGVITQDDREAGSLRTALGRRGLAMLRVDQLDRTLRLGAITITPILPPWLKLAPAEKVPA